MELDQLRAKYKGADYIICTESPMFDYQIIESLPCYRENTERAKNKLKTIMSMRHGEIKDYEVIMYQVRIRYKHEIVKAHKEKNGHVIQ